MAYKDLHDKPFDESTIAKLEIFEDYAQAWIPTFVMQGHSICIFDFFAGTGYDKNGIAGSPIRILNKIKEQVIPIFQKKVSVKVIFNEFDQNKFKLLKQACSEYLSENDHVGRAIQIEYFNEDFEELFPKLLPKIKELPSLVYIDQNGLKFLSDKYLLELEKLKQTDFLYFASASYLWRFGDSKEFQTHIDIDMSEVKNQPYKFVHRSLIKELKKKLPFQTELKLYPFSLKKGANIYGIIFGASHPRAVEKFLSIAWKRNETNGEADFDIDDDDLKIQQTLFGSQSLTKLELFCKNIRSKILSGEITNNIDLYNFALEEGHLGKHAADVLRELKKKGDITYESISPLVTYENVYKMKRKLIYSILKK
jgi:three-Cys-motif partner protein